MRREVGDRRGIRCHQRHLADRAEDLQRAGTVQRRCNGVEIGARRDAHDDASGRRRERDRSLEIGSRGASSSTSGRQTCAKATAGRSSATARAGRVEPSRHSIAC
jgi:hypothetical protein